MPCVAGARLRSVDMKHHTHESWNTWYQDLCQPLKPAPCGEDLKYQEQFSALKASFSSIEAIDYKLTFVSCTQLLASKSKDMRLLSYVCCAAANEYGVEGLIFALKLMNYLTDMYVEEMYPSSPKARKAVHIWLLGQQRSIIVQIEAKDNWNAQQLFVLKTELDVYGAATTQGLDQAAGPLVELANWTNKLLIKHPVKAKFGLQVENKKEQKKCAEKITSVSSNSEYLALLRKLLKHDNEQHNFPRLIALSRAARWSDIKLPPNQQGKTRITAPRINAFDPIINALAERDYVSALLSGEVLFMEGAMHFNMDLQCYMLSALKGLTQPGLSAQLSLTVFSLISRLPQLPSLLYEDGSCFCSAHNKTVLQSLKQQFSASACEVPQQDSYSQVEKKAQTLVEQGQLHKALTLLSQLPVSDEYDIARLMLLKATLCLQAQRFDFAEPMINELLHTIKQYHLNRWRKDFSMQVWRNAIDCFSSLSKTKDDHYAQVTRDLRQQMILTQPELALDWM
jgi:type VI secretion system protein VasJ